MSFLKVQPTISRDHQSLFHLVSGFSYLLPDNRIWIEMSEQFGSTGFHIFGKRFVLS